MAATERLPDLTPLNPAEREVLALLAQGHTVKSIATLTGKTEGSVNERLREARRKTGVASSRELARLLAEMDSPKNRDEQIGVASTAAGDPEAPSNATPRRGGRLGKGAIAMAFVSGAAIFGLALFWIQQPPQSAAPDVDPVLGNSFATKPAPSLAELHGQVRSEARDAGWAPVSEAAIRAQFMKHAGLGQAGDVLRVTCGKTLCEVALTMTSGNDRRVASVMNGIQKAPLQDAMNALGVTNEIMSFGRTGDQPPKSLHVSYWRRK